MLIPAPEEKELTALVGKSLYGVWNKLCALSDEHYDMDLTWNNGGKAWTYEYKFRRRGKTLCALYAKESRIGFMVILGKDERASFEKDRGFFASKVRRAYDNAQTYHDGKWLMFEPIDDSLFKILFVC